MESVGIKLPELTNPLVVEYGFDADGKPVDVTFNWLLGALKRSNYARFVALQDEESANAERKINAAAIEDNEALAAALAPPIKNARGKKTAQPEAVSEATERYKKVDAALLDLAVDLENAQQEFIAQGEGADPLEIFGKKIQAVNNALAMMQPFIVRDPAELESEIEKRRATYIEANEIKAGIHAKQLEHLCSTFQFGSGEKIPCTAESLLEVFESEFLEKAVMAVIEAHRGPLRTRVVTGA